MSESENKDTGTVPLQKFADLESAEARVEATLGKIESKTPGRMRVRLKPELRNAADMARIEAILRQHPNVRSVTVNPNTGSVVIEHDLQKDGHEVIGGAIKESELILGAIFDVPVEEEGEDGQEEGDAYARLDQQLADTVYKIDKVVYKKTGLRFRGQILAGTIAALGVAQMAIYGITLETLSGPFLIWIGWDIFHRSAMEPPLEDDGAETGEQTAEEIEPAQPSGTQGAPAAA